MVDEVDSDQSKMKRIITELESVKPGTPEVTEYRGHTYRRDNKTIAQLKILRRFKCQVCGLGVKKKDGSNYIEAAHIKRKVLKGPETPDNILILCPNHHKEFDLGDTQIVEQSTNRIVLTLNGAKYDIDLSLKSAAEQYRK